MTKNHLQRFSYNHGLDVVDGIVFLNTEAFSNYMSKFDPKEIQAIKFDDEKNLWAKELNKKSPIEMDSDSMAKIIPLF